MADDHNLTLEILRELREGQKGIKADLAALRASFAAMEQHLGAFYSRQAVQSSEIASIMERLRVLEAKTGIEPSITPPQH